jgi:hypothetical protein
MSATTRTNTLPEWVAPFVGGAFGALIVLVAVGWGVNAVLAVILGGALTGTLAGVTGLLLRRSPHER